MSTGRPRAHSASSIKSLHYIHKHGGKLSKKKYQSNPELLQIRRSMISGLNTTVPLNIICDGLNSRQKSKPKPKTKPVPKPVEQSTPEPEVKVEKPKKPKKAPKPKKQYTHDDGKGKKCTCCACCRKCCKHCCRLELFLVLMQMFIGIGITALAFYLQMYAPSLKIRQIPYWAGIPLCLAGLLGIYFCATHISGYARTIRARLIKKICLFLSTCCIFVCLIASAFQGIHIHRLLTFDRCVDLDNSCACSETASVNSRIFFYDSVKDCDSVLVTIKFYSIIECVLNTVGSILSFWFVILLWKNRYGQFKIESSEEYTKVRVEDLNGV